MVKPIKIVNFGGLTYDVNQVKYARDNGDGTFTISFKTGETLTYPEQSQSPGVYPRVSQWVDNGWIYDDTSFIISDVMGATFKSSKDTVSHVTLDNCKQTEVDLAANNSRWYGDEATIKGGEENEVILDKNDSAVINGKSINGKGTAAQKDYPE
jgi:hypothetical protein